MNVIKRDGRIVDYNRAKIVIAIQKANEEVKPKEKITSKQIEEIADVVESSKKKNLQVEEIQDIIESELVKANKYALSKAYILYRYKRAMVRKSNTTDDTILSIIRNDNKELKEENSNKNTFLASTQRDYIAGEVSKDLTQRVLLPEKIVEAHKNGILHFHDMDYFVQPIQ